MSLLVRPALAIVSLFETDIPSADWWSLSFEILLVSWFVSFSNDSAAICLCLFLFLPRSWPALASQSCSSQVRRRIRNLPILTSVTDRNPTILIGYFLLTARPLFAYIKGPIQASKSISSARSRTSTICLNQLTKETILNFQKKGLLFKQFSSRIYGYQPLASGR